MANVWQVEEDEISSSPSTSEQSKKPSSLERWGFLIPMKVGQTIVRLRPVCLAQALLVDADFMFRFHAGLFIETIGSRRIRGIHA